MTKTKKKKIVILGGGFGGTYTARYLEKLIKHQHDKYEIILVSRDNYFTYQPMISEVIGGSLGVFDSVSSLRSLLKHTTLYIKDIIEIDQQAQTVTLAPNFCHKDIILNYDHLVLAYGTVTDFRNAPGGLKEHAFPFKTLNDAFNLRNQIIEVIEAAAYEKDPDERRSLLTFAVAGGGFSGIESVAEINDLARRMTRKYKTIKKEDIRVILIHSKNTLVDRELPESLGVYCAKILKKRGVEILFNRHLESATPQEVILDGDEHIACRTVVSTVPSGANPLTESLGLETIKGHILTDQYMKVPNTKNIYAIGDCAAIPLKNGTYCPPSAQFAIRQAKCLANNIMASFEKKRKKKPFSFKALGLMAALGHKRAVGELFGFVRLSGVFAWLVWRFVYWCKLPGFNRKIKVFFSWLLEVFIPAEPVQFRTEATSSIKHLHYAQDEYVFKKGDVGDLLYLILDGSVDVLEVDKDGNEKKLAVLTQGQYFGEMALLSKKHRTANIRCREDCNFLGIRKGDFNILIANFTDLREDFLKTEKKRSEYLDSQGNIHPIGDLANPIEEEPKAENE